MRGNILFILIIIISLTIVSCKENETQSYNTTPPVTTIPTVTTTIPAEEVVPEEPATQEELINAIINDIETALTNDKTEYDAFMNVLNKIETYFNDSTDENLSEAITLCNELHTQLSNASKYLSPLTEEELAAITEFGMDIYAYDDLFNNFTFFRNIKISALEGLNIQLSEISESQNSLDAIVTFYKEYNRLFQIDMYYNVNHYINECNIEDESVDNFKNNFYPNLINDFSDSMKWEDDNDVIIEISEQLQSNLEDIVNEFTENSNLVGDEISGNE